MTEAELLEIEARTEKATPGPWIVEPSTRDDLDTAAFIAAARQDVPALIAEVRRLRSIEKAARAYVEVFESGESATSAGFEEFDALVWALGKEQA